MTETLTLSEEARGQLREVAEHSPSVRVPDLQPVLEGRDQITRVRDLAAIALETGAAEYNDLDELEDVYERANEVLYR